MEAQVALSIKCSSIGADVSSLRIGCPLLHLCWTWFMHVDDTPLPGWSSAPTNSPTVGLQGGACQHSRIPPCTVECASSSDSARVGASRSDAEGKAQSNPPALRGQRLDLYCKPDSSERQNKPRTCMRRFDPRQGLVDHHGNVYPDRRKLRERREGRSPIPSELDYSYFFTNGRCTCTAKHKAGGRGPHGRRSVWV